MTIAQSKAAPTPFNSSLNQTTPVKLDAYLTYLGIVSTNSEGGTSFKVSREGHDTLLVDIPGPSISEHLTIPKPILREPITPELLRPVAIAPGTPITEDSPVVLPPPNIIPPAPPLEPPKTDNKISKYKLKLPNGVTIFSKDPVISEAFTKVMQEFPQIFGSGQGFVKIPEEDWMCIPLRKNWKELNKGKVKIYPLRTKNKAVVNETFNKLHDQGWITWTANSTPFTFPAFIVWKPGSNSEKKGRVIIDIHHLNQIVLNDAYPLPLQADIIAATKDCAFISVVDCASFFYQ